LNVCPRVELSLGPLRRRWFFLDLSFAGQM
jgi:hypothetical protein